MISYHGRVFRTVSNSENGEVNNATIFHYEQDEDIVTATYRGGGIRQGQILALVKEEGVLDMRYHHLNDEGAFMTGTCTSVPELLPDGRLRLHERWKWTSGDCSEGASVVEEVGA